MGRSVVVATLLAVAGSQIACAATTFTEDTVIQDGDDFHSVEVWAGAHLDVIGGNIGNRLQILHDSSVDILLLWGLSNLP